MTNVRFVLNSPAWLRTISRKKLAVWIAGAILASTFAHAQAPVEVPKASAAVLAQEHYFDIRWAAFELITLAVPLFFLFSGLAARLRRICDSISGHRWFLTVTLFAFIYMLLATLIALPFKFLVSYIAQPHIVAW